MGEKTSLPADLIRGSLKTIVLKLLDDNGRMYGYEITRSVEEITNGKIKLTYGALYPVLHKLEGEGILITEAENYNNRIRIYYSLAPGCSSVVTQKIQEMNDFIEAVRKIVDPKAGLSHV